MFRSIYFIQDITTIPDFRKIRPCLGGYRTRHRNLHRRTARPGAPLPQSFLPFSPVPTILQGFWTPGPDSIIQKNRPWIGLRCYGVTRRQVGHGGIGVFLGPTSRGWDSALSPRMACPFQMGFRLSGLDGSNDFDELGGVAIIGSGETSVTVRVSTTDDATDERDPGRRDGDDQFLRRGAAAWARVAFLVLVALTTGPAQAAWVEHTQENRVASSGDTVFRLTGPGSLRAGESATCTLTVTRGPQAGFDDMLAVEGAVSGDRPYKTGTQGGGDCDLYLSHTGQEGVSFEQRHTLPSRRSIPPAGNALQRKKAP